MPTRSVRRLHRAPLLLALAAACSTPRGPGPQDATDAPHGTGAPADPAGGLAVDGQLSTRYRARWSDGASDQDAYASLLLDVGEADGGPWRAHLDASLIVDVDRLSDPRDPQDFFSLQDTYDDDAVLRAYEGWVGLDGAGPLDDVRLGRQMDVLTPELAWFDGGRVVARREGDAHLELGLYGGVPVHLYESSSEGDLVVGAWAQAQPWTGARARLDWMHLEDEQLLGEARDDLLAVALDQQVARPLRVELAYSRLEGNDRDARATVVWAAAEHDLVLRASHYQLLSAQQQLTLELDPFTTALQALEPFGQTLLMASKGFGERLFVEAGFDLRRLVDSDDEGPSNREFERAFVTGTLLELSPLEVTLALTGDVWQSGDDEIQSWGFDLSRRFGRGLDVSLGSAYALYEFDAFQGVERDHVRTWYARVRRRRTDGVDLQVRYELEDTDDDDYGSLRIGSTWRF